MSYYNEGKWWASPFNDLEEVRKIIEVEPQVKIHDATLRDGEQTPGVVFDIDAKIRIAELLDELGVERIEVGMPAVSQSDYQAAKEISKRNLKAETFVFARATRQDIDMAAEAGAKGVIIEVPIGYPKLKYQFNWTWEKVAEKSIDCINYAKNQGLTAVFFPYDTTRARVEDLEQLINALTKEAVPHSIGVVDTMGCALPETIQYLVRKIKKLTNGLPVEVHTHNDFGMAVATELAGIAAGASCVHSCINGLGERTGNAALEHLMVSMKILLDMPNDYHIEKLPYICEEVSKISGVPIPLNMPVSGVRNYTRESGIGVDLVMKEPLAMFATAPALYGKTGDIKIGKKSGKASVEYFLDKFHLQATDEEIGEILNRIKAEGAEKKRLLTDDEFKEIHARAVK
ncbi:MAG: 2-isopropylmalate synthase [Bacillota bacterium]|jgi:methanogen homocitrate synthase|nr:2-isopropylmalate synthase [Bacillota bacterium]